MPINRVMALGWNRFAEGQTRLFVVGDLSPVEKGRMTESEIPLREERENNIPI